jgi:hypothetical protein
VDGPIQKSTNNMVFDNRFETERLLIKLYEIARIVSKSQPKYDPRRIILDQVASLENEFGKNY